MPLVELIRGSATDDATIDAVRALAADLGKQVIVSADRPGLHRQPDPDAAPRRGDAGARGGDRHGRGHRHGARVGLNHPMGPLALADFIGLDVVLGIMRVLHADLGDERFRPPRVLEDLVAAGKLGQKSGAGFFTYPRA